VGGGGTCVKYVFLTEDASGRGIPLTWQCEDVVGSWSIVHVSSMLIMFLTFRRIRSAKE
jgi:hypothetical protein